MNGKDVNISVLLGQTIISIVNQYDELLIETSTGKKYQMLHHQDCCESVDLEDVCGDLNDLLNTPVTVAYESSHEKSDMGDLLSILEKVGLLANLNIRRDDSETWTFYRIGTVNGDVTLRWHGSSNGYYSESVSFEELIYKEEP